LSINRMSFQDTPDYLNSLGFLNRLSLSFQTLNEIISINKGSLIYGFKNNDGDPYGFVYDNNIDLVVPPQTGNYYITVNNEGAFSIDLGNPNSIRGLGANIAGIPWYTYNNKALVAKVFKSSTMITGYIVCDDAYWCEFEGSF